MQSYQEKEKYEYKNVTKKFIENIIKTLLLDSSISIITGHTLHSSTIGRENHSYYIKKVKNHYILRNETLDRCFEFRIVPRYFQNPLFVLNF